MTSGVYKLTFSSGRRYIGKSIDIPTRWKQHFDKFAKGTAAKAMQAEFNSCGYPKTEVIVVCHPDHIDKVEASMINRLKPELNATYPACPWKNNINEQWDYIYSWLNRSTLEHIICLQKYEKALEINSHTIEELEELNDELLQKRDEEDILADIDNRVAGLKKELYRTTEALLAANREIERERKVTWWQRLFR